MKLKFSTLIKSANLTEISRLVPIMALAGIFIAINLFLAANSADREDGQPNGAETAARQERDFMSVEIDDEISPTTEDIIVMYEGVEIHVKKLTFNEFPEDEMKTTEESEYGFKVITETVLLDEEDFEDTVRTELSEDDYDIAYIPYKEAISVVKSEHLYQAFELDSERCFLSFDDENIGIITRSYPAAGLFYNKRILEAAGLEDPMELYKRGEWDLDNFYSYLQKTSVDIDSDGINEIYGIVINEDLTDNLAAANGAQILYVSDEGNLNIDIYNPEFKEVLNFINKVYTSGFKGGMSKQGFIDGRGCFYNDDASVYRELSDVMYDEIGFICYPSDKGIVRSASANIEVAVINSGKEIDEQFLDILEIMTSPEITPEEYFIGIFKDADITLMCVEMTGNNYVSPIYMFKELHNMYLDMLRDIKAGLGVSEAMDTFNSNVTEGAVLIYN